MPVKHAFVSGLADDPAAAAAGEVLPQAHWNADHTGSNLTVADEGTPLDTAVTSLDFTGAGVTASAVGHAVTVNVPGGDGVTISDRAPINGTPASFTVDYHGATGGNVTWVVNGNTTAALAFDANETAITAAIEAADPSVTGLVTVEAGGPPWLVTFTVAITPVTLIIGTDNLTGGSQGAEVTGSGGTAPDHAAAGTRWLNTDDRFAYTNYGSQAVPVWLQDGTLTSQLGANISGNGYVIFDIGSLTVRALSAGGSGFYTDEVNVQGQDATTGAAVISAASDPTAVGGYTPDYVQGTLFLRNPVDSGATPGAAFLKEGTTQGAWAQLLTFGNGASLPTANPGPGFLWNDSGTVKVGT